MPKWKSVTIVGVGLIGGSIGKALRQRGLAEQVIGVGRRLSSLRTARRVGAVDRFRTDIASGVAEADLIVVCTPVGQIAEHVREAARHCPEGGLITDAGSSKARIVRRLQRLPRKVSFVGSHPLAGSEKTGPAHADAELFQGRVTVVTPTSRTPPGNLRRVKAFWRSLGSRVVERSPRSHDAALAATSHVPHAVATALAAATPSGQLELTGTGWRDTTRIAAGDVELWEQILRDNQAPVLKALENFEKVLASLREAIARDDPRAIRRILQSGKRNRDAVGN